MFVFSHIEKGDGGGGGGGGGDPCQQIWRQMASLLLSSALRLKKKDVLENGPLSSSSFSLLFRGGCIQTRKAVYYALLLFHSNSQFRNS